MLDVLEGFLAELREAGLPISVRETIDAAEAIEAVGLTSRTTLRSALRASVVKSPEQRPVFDSAFEAYFSLRASSVELDELGARSELDVERPPGEGRTASSEGGGRPLEPEELSELALEALRSGEHDRLAAVARLAVAMYAGVDPTRPVGASYYLHRTMRGLAPEALIAALLAQLANPAPDDELARSASRLGGLGRGVAEGEYRTRLDALRDLAAAEIRRLLIADRGSAAVAKALRRPLLDDVDFMHASRDELVAMRRTIYPLARILASRLARRRRHRRRGPLDFKSTLRRSLSTGGVPVELRYRPPHVARPELFLLADISGSVAAFARFTLQLVYALQAQFAKVRIAVFIDGVDEVTRYFKSASSLGEAMEAIGRHADVVFRDGHSNYGSAFGLFEDHFGRAINSRTNLIILGDARNNYHQTNAESLGRLHKRAHRVLWLNPEPHTYWGSGDSVLEEYARHCDGVFECRNLRQLKAFIDELA